MIEKSMKIQKAVFHQAVWNSNGDSETNFDANDPKEHRRVEMWLSGNLLICLHKSKYFAVPLTNVVYVRF